MIFSFLFLNTTPTSCSTRFRAFTLIPFMEYDVVLPPIFVNYFTLVFREDGSSFVIHCFAFCLDCSFCSRVCCSDSSLLSPCVKKNCSWSATSEEEFVTNMGVVCTSSRILRWTFPETFSSNLETKSATVLTEPAICAMLKLNCST